MDTVKHWDVVANAYAWLGNCAREECRTGHASAHVRAFWAVEEAKALGQLFDAYEDEHVHLAVLRRRQERLAS